MSVPDFDTQMPALDATDLLFQGVRLRHYRVHCIMVLPARTVNGLRCPVSLLPSPP